MHTRHLRRRDAEHARLRRRALPAGEQGQHVGAHALADAIFLPQRLAHLALQPPVERGEVFPLAPRVEVKRGLKRLAEGALPLVRWWIVGPGLPGQGRRYPRELSAGMQQRVGIARAFALSPRLLLLDEPFSLLDALTRMELQDQLMALWEAERKTVIMVTHDVDEAILLADRIVMMTNGPAATVGEVLDVAFPRPRRREELFDRPDYFWLRDAILGFLESQSRASA